MKHTKDFVSLNYIFLMLYFVPSFCRRGIALIYTTFAVNCKALK